MTDHYPGFTQWIELFGLGIDALGVAVIILGVVFYLFRFLARIERLPWVDAYRKFRENLGRTILLGLELLIAGDIIRTVAVTPTYRSVGLLAIIILIRLFLSMQLEVEINGRFPWQAKKVTPDN